MNQVHTTIGAVTVYPDRARVTRRGAATLEPGNHRLEIKELPLALDTASVRAAAHGTARARLLGVDVRRLFYVDTPDEVVHQLEKEIEALQDEMEVLNIQIERLREERAALQGLLGATEVYAKGLAFGKTTPADQMALFDSLRQRAANLDAQLQTLRVTHRDQERTLEKLQKELDQMRSARGKERYVAVVEVDVTEGGSLTLELTYVVSRAGWTPLFDVRLSDEETTVEVGYLGQVVQRTGEDWTDVAMTLSTARPALAATLPELDPWYVGPMPRPAKRAARADLMRAAAPTPALALEDMALAEEEESYEAETVTAMVETSGAAVTYVLPGAVSIPPDGNAHKVTVAHVPLAPRLDYVSAPKLVEAAYRRAQVVNESPYTLLPGPANLFAGDEFIGTTELKLTAPGGEIELYLGVDDRVRVKRELKRHEVDKRLLGDRRRIWAGYEIEVENLLDAEAAITLYDQIPITRHEQIKVRLESAEPKPTTQTELGILEWELTLSPREEQIVRFDFVVEHPRDLTLVGLP